MSDIAKKSAETFVTRVLMQLCAAAGGIVIARVLHPAGKGEWTYVGTMLGLALMATVGHNKAVLWQYARRGLPPASIIRVMSLVVGAISVPIAIGLVISVSSCLRKEGCFSWRSRCRLPFSRNLRLGSSLGAATCGS